MRPEHIRKADNCKLGVPLEGSKRKGWRGKKLLPPERACRRHPGDGRQGQRRTAGNPETEHLANRPADSLSECNNKAHSLHTRRASGRGNRTAPEIH